MVEPANLQVECKDHVYFAFDEVCDVQTAILRLQQDVLNFKMYCYGIEKRPLQTNHNNPSEKWL